MWQVHAPGPPLRPELSARLVLACVPVEVEELPLQEAMDLPEHLVVQADRDDDEHGLVAQLDVVVLGCVPHGEHIHTPSPQSGLWIWHSPK